MSSQSPAFTTKLFFWIILGSMSTFFAEVIAGSCLFPFLPNIDAWGIISVIPLYTLHILVLSHLVYQYGKPRFYVLFIAGAIFGMYEAYATGVLWTGFDTDEGVMISILGLGVIETIMLVFLWHPLMAFMIPIAIGETALTNTKESLEDIGKYTTRRFLCLGAIVFGLIQAFNISSPTLSLFVGLANIPILALLIYMWRKANLNQYSMRALLPNQKQFIIILVLLILQYLFLGSLNADKFPDLIFQLFVWFIYLILFFLLFRSLKKSKHATDNTQKVDRSFSWKTFALLSIIFICSSMIFSIFISPIKQIVWFVLLPLYVTLGITLFLYSLWKIFGRN